MSSSAALPARGDSADDADGGKDDDDIRFPTLGGAACSGGSRVFGQAVLYLRTVLRGKHLMWRRELDRLELGSDEHLLDAGCSNIPGRASSFACRRFPNQSPRAVVRDMAFVPVRVSVPTGHRNGPE
ncbi:hypothetical protein MSIM_49170 [Mycobacterium simiae]|nr:hypothetical protein MSIM_49170 [Mycobacterium simiae]